MTSNPPTDQQPDLDAIAARTNDDPFFVTDCEGKLAVWREKALTHVRRDEHGQIDMYSLPSLYRSTDEVIETIYLDSWGPGEDATDDQRRQDINDLVDSRAALPLLLAEVRRLRAELADQQAETEKLIRWHGEDETAMKRMRGTIERLRAQLADQGAYEKRLREQHDLDVTTIAELRARVTELERPAVEAKRNEIRQSYAELVAAAEETKDFEGAFDVQCRLREREEQWAAEDAAARPSA